MKLTRPNFPRFDWNRTITGAGPALLMVFYIILATLTDLRTAVAELTGLTGVIVILLAFILYRGEKQAPEWPIWLILIVALLIRLPFLIRPPELSDDIYRYLWDGLQLLSGKNPYALAPAEIPAATDSLATIKNAINHPHLVTIYGPAAELFFALASLLGGTITGFKMTLTLVDLGCCYLLCRLLGRLRIPLWKSVLYAWHPMPVVEIAGSGHIEGVGLFFLLAALLSLTKNYTPAKAARQENSYWAAGLFTSCSVLVKLFPAVFLLGILLLSTQQKRSGTITFTTSFLLISIALIVPFYPEISNGLQTLHTYGATWEFSSFFFRSVRSLLGSSLIARLCIGLLFLLCAGRLYFRLYHFLKTCPEQARPLAILKTFYALSLLFLFLTPTLHPWYGLSLVLLLPFAASPCGLVLSWSLFLSYQVMISYSLLEQWQENDGVNALIWLGPLTALGLQWINHQRKTLFDQTKKDTLPG